MIMSSEFAEGSGRRDDDERLESVLERHPVQDPGGLGGETVLADLAGIGLIIGASARTDAREGTAGDVAPQVTIGAALLLVLFNEFQVRELGVTAIAQQEHLLAVGDHHETVMLELHRRRLSLLREREATQFGCSRLNNSGRDDRSRDSR